MGENLKPRRPREVLERLQEVCALSFLVLLKLNVEDTVQLAENTPAMLGYTFVPPEPPPLKHLVKLHL